MPSGNIGANEKHLAARDRRDELGALGIGQRGDRPPGERECGLRGLRLRLRFHLGRLRRLLRLQ